MRLADNAIFRFNIVQWGLDHTDADAIRIQRRMYAVSSEAETAWKELIAHIAEEAGTADPGHPDGVMCCVKRDEF